MESKPIAASPTPVPISHNGIRPVVPVFDINIWEFLTSSFPEWKHIRKDFHAYIFRGSCLPNTKSSWPWKKSLVSR